MTAARIKALGAILFVVPSVIWSLIFLYLTIKMGDCRVWVAIGSIISVAIGDALMTERSEVEHED